MFYLPVGIVCRPNITHHQKCLLKVLALYCNKMSGNVLLDVGIVCRPNITQHQKCLLKVLALYCNKMSGNVLLARRNSVQAKHYSSPEMSTQSACIVL